MGKSRILKCDEDNSTKLEIEEQHIVRNRNSILIGALSVAVAFLRSLGTVEAASHDVQWTFGNLGFQSYILNSYSPPETDLGTIGAQDPVLTLELGKRYQVSVINYGTHPFELIAKGTTAGADTVILSMGSPVGSLESDAEVGWADDGLGTVAFTMTFSLCSAMSGPGQQPGYRCRPHSSTMRGNFVVLGAPIPGAISKGKITIELETIASGLAAPIDLKPAADGTGRLFVVDQAGKVYVIADGQVQSEPFLDVTARIVSPLGIIGTYDENDYDERGLLGMALHPGFAEAASPGYQKVYTYASEPSTGQADFTTDPEPEAVNHHSVLAEWTVDSADPSKIDTASRREILRIVQPQFNHNGGMLAFGPDGYLYISVGDGGASTDVGDGHGVTGNGQNTNTVHGSILRIDPLHPSGTAGSANPVSANGQYRVPADNPFVGREGVDEIFAYGFRNPFRFGFDSATGQLIAADVGQDHVEEIDIVEIGGNYGWNLEEGTFSFDPDTGDVSEDLSGLPSELIDPAAQYDHDDGISVIGGYVYRGAAIPELAGKYVFGDFSRSFSPADGRLFYADLDTGDINEFRIGVENLALDIYVKGFGQDVSGELYVLAGSNLGPYGTGGVVLKIVDLCVERIPGDVNNDCQVNFEGFAAMASNWLRDTQR